MKVILALLMAGIMMAAMIAPAMSDSATSSATVGNVAPTIVDMKILDALTDMTNPSANDLALAPSGTVTITVEALVEDLNGNADISSVDLTNIGGLIVTDTIPKNMAAFSVVSPTQQWYTVTLSVQYYNPAAEYTLTTVAEDTATQQDTESKSFDVLATAPSISVAVMAFGTIAPGGSADSSHTVTNQGNVVVDFDDKVPVTGYDDPHTDAATDDEITWDDFAGIGTLEDGDMTTSYGGEDVAVFGTHDVPFTLSIPPGTKPGAYTGTTYFTPSTV